MGEVPSRNFTINFGPQHPAAHGVPTCRRYPISTGSITLERVTLLKPTRVGFTCLLTSAIAYYVVRDPAPILVLLPTEADCRDFLVSDVEPLFEASPKLQGRPPIEVYFGGCGQPG